MKQLIIKKGIAINEEVPAPVIQDGFVLIKVAYSCISAGTEMSGVETGRDITNVKPGDKVAAAGGGYAIHADYVLVPKNLVVKIPDGVSLDEASSATIGAIALHGVHRASLTIGEFCAVIGCGIIGLFTIQILKSAGIKVAAVDLDQRRLDLAKAFGAELVINS